MKCPICGCKMKKEIVCPYCKITGDEVRFASNKEAKRRIDRGDTKEVYNSTYIPYDVDRRKLMWITIFGGFFGIDAYVMGRKKRGIIQTSIILFSFLVYLLYQYVGLLFLHLPTEFLTLVCSVFMIMWFTAIFNIVFLKKAIIPVVLPTKQELKDRIVEREAQIKENANKKEARAKAKYDKLIQKEKRKMEEAEKKKNKEKEKKDEK